MGAGLIRQFLYSMQSSGLAFGAWVVSELLSLVPLTNSDFSVSNRLITVSLSVEVGLRSG